jgi:hypothetical protein
VRQIEKECASPCQTWGLRYIVGMREILTHNDLPKDDIYVLYYYADWLIYDRTVRLSLAKMEKKYSRIKFYCINVDLVDKKDRRSIKSIPHIQIYNQNRVIGFLNGVQLHKTYREFFSITLEGLHDKN